MFYNISLIVGIVLNFIAIISNILICFVNDENKLQKAAIEFEGTNGEYTAYYSVGKEKTVKEGIPFIADGQIGFEILSSERADDKDKVSVQVDIVNNTDTIVYLSVQNDDEENPRVTIKGKTGDIFTK